MSKLAKDPETTVLEFFEAVENSDWDGATTRLLDDVRIGHGDSWQHLTRKQLTTQWAASHTGLEHVAYRVTPVSVETTTDHAHLCLDAEITLGRTPTSRTERSTITGDYHVELQHIDGNWLITSLNHRTR
jgi:hypothetical protein